MKSLEWIISSLVALITFVIWRAIILSPLSGMMLQNFVVLDATNTKFTIGLLPPVQDYGYAVNQTRGFIGLADKEVDQLVQIVKANLLGE